MPRFSIIIPVYNTAEFLNNCLLSILNQTYKDYEVIIINDGSTDSSNLIIEKHVKKYNNFKAFYQQNQGNSIAKNVGADKAIGKYLIFLDSDDTIEKDLLFNLSKYENNLIRYQFNVIKNNKINILKEIGFEDLNGPEAFRRITKYKIIDSPCCYAYNRNFYIKNSFKFAEYRYHEDFGLIPLVIMKAKTVTSIEYNGYNYIERSGSIMNNNNYEKEVKKAYDVLEQYKTLYGIINNDNYTIEDKKHFNSFIANTTILKAKNLKKDDFKNYVKLLEENNVFSNILTDTLSRKLKKMLMVINLKLYLKVIK